VECDVVYDVALGVLSVVIKIQQANGSCNRRPGRQPNTPRNRESDRLLRQYPGIAHRPIGQSYLYRIVMPHSRSLSGRVYASGFAVREARRRITTCKRCRPFTAVPGDDGLGNQGGSAPARPTVRIAGRRLGGGG